MHKRPRVSARRLISSAVILLLAVGLAVPALGQIVQDRQHTIRQSGPGVSGVSVTSTDAVRSDRQVSDGYTTGHIYSDSRRYDSQVGGRRVDDRRSYDRQVNERIDGRVYDDRQTGGRHIDRAGTSPVVIGGGCYEHVHRHGWVHHGELHIGSSHAHAHVHCPDRRSGVGTSRSPIQSDLVVPPIGSPIR